jgi:hypothetical protein
MPSTETRLTWTPTAPGEVEVHIAECGLYAFEICISAATKGYLLRMWRIRLEDSAILFWERDGYSLDEAKERAERLADQHVPVILEQ